MRKPGRPLFLKVIISLILVVIFALSLTGVAKAILINRKLSGSLVAGGDVKSFEISPDGSYAVFLADARINTVDELFSVPVGGGERIRISQDLGEGLIVQGFVITPDSQSVVYWIGDIDDYCTHIFAVPISGGSSVDISGSIPDYKQLSKIAITADSQYAVYSLAHVEYEVNRYEVLWAAPLDGNGSTSLAGGTFAQSIDFQLAPNVNEVVYVIHPFSGPFYISKVNMLGVSEVLAGDYGSMGYFTITADGDWIVFTTMIESSIYELFSIPYGGGPTIQLSGTMVDDGTALDFKVAPNSQTVVYRADELVNERVELFSVPVDGSEMRVRLLDVMIADGDVEEYEITPNSLGVVYRADQLVDDRFDLGAVGIYGGTEYWLNKEMVPDGDVTAFSIAPNSLGVAFIADKNSDETYELFIVSTVGTLLHRLNADLPEEGDVLDFKFAPNSQGVVYRADQVINDVFGLYVVPSVGDAIPVRLNKPLVAGGDIHEAYAITPDNKSVLYLADQEVDEVDELFATLDRIPVYLPMVMK